jgi:hypothetical protein
MRMYIAAKGDIKAGDVHERCKNGKVIAKCVPIANSHFSGHLRCARSLGLAWLVFALMTVLELVTREAPR